MAEMNIRITITLRRAMGSAPPPSSASVAILVTSSGQEALKGARVMPQPSLEKELSQTKRAGATISR
jgi:hypothetical protein